MATPERALFGHSIRVRGKITIKGSRYRNDLSKRKTATSQAKTEKKSASIQIIEITVHARSKKKCINFKAIEVLINTCFHSTDACVVRIRSMVSTKKRISGWIGDNSTEKSFALEEVVETTALLRHPRLLPE